MNEFFIKRVSKFNLKPKNPKNNPTKAKKGRDIVLKFITGQK